jgi:succinate dehydrogenase / fumarate reductase cytochrome b subunit
MSETTPSPADRPLSPHLQVYRPLINMMMSIMHRITGAALYGGTILLAAWLAAAAFSPDGFGLLNGLLGTWLGKLVLIGFTWAVLHHLLGGVRHLIWDMGWGFNLKMVDILSWGTLLLSLALTAIIWGVALFH